MTLKKATLLIIAILVIDQISKIYIKTHFQLSDGVEVISWFKIHFVENEGMAWGAKIPGSYGKLILTLFRLVAIVGIGYWLWDAARKKSANVLLVAISLIFSGAFGNIIDSVFYGLIFESSNNQVANWVSFGEGYGELFHGKVVDMLSFSFFDPVFNIADMSISTGVGLLLVFNRKAFPKKKENEE